MCPATTSCLLVPKTAYRPNDASSVYNPAWGGNPARVAYAMPSGMSSPQIVKPAIASFVSQAR